MNSWRRVVATLGVAAMVAAACALLGVWQWDRHVERSSAVAVLESWADAAPVLVEDALSGTDPVPDEQVWRSVVATGHYLSDAQVLLRNRPVDGQVGFHVLAPFAIDSGALAGRVLLVDRGWLDADQTASVTPTVPDPPDGRVDLVARLRQAEPPSGRDAPAGQVQAIAVQEASSAAALAWQESALDAYAQATTESGAAPAGLEPLARPSTDLGPHLSYAFQWWVFAVGALVGAVILLRREESPQPVRRRRSTAEQEEDALLDAQERAASTG